MFNLLLLCCLFCYMVQAVHQRLSRNLGILPSPINNHQVLFMCVSFISFPKESTPPQFHLYFLIVSCTCLSPSYNLFHGYIHLLWVNILMETSGFKFLSMTFFIPLEKTFREEPRQSYLFLYPQWLAECLFGTEASLNISLNEKRNISLFRKSPNKTRMGNVEGELLETDLQTRFLRVKPRKGAKELAVGLREVGELGVWNCRTPTVITCAR